LLIFAGAGDRDVGFLKGEDGEDSKHWDRAFASGDKASRVFEGDVTVAVATHERIKFAQIDPLMIPSTSEKTMSSDGSNRVGKTVKNERQIGNIFFAREENIERLSAGIPIANR
jgi:hypothetical protein